MRYTLPKSIHRRHLEVLMDEVCKAHLNWCESTPGFGGATQEDYDACNSWKKHVRTLLPRLGDFVVLPEHDIKVVITRLQAADYVLYEGGAYYAADAILAQSLRQYIGRQA